MFLLSINISFVPAAPDDKLNQAEIEKSDVPISKVSLSVTVITSLEPSKLYDLFDCPFLSVVKEASVTAPS